MQKSLYITIAGLLFYLTANSQISELRKIDKDLSATFKKISSIDNYENRDSIESLFKTQLIKQLKKPITFNNTLDSLSKLIGIKQSADRKIKFYCWTIPDGSWHGIEVFAQFISDKNKISVQQINTEQTEEATDYTDSYIYQVNEFMIDTTKYYLTFASGTHGSGMKHQIVQIFKIEGDKLIKCKSCFENNMDLIIEYYRASDRFGMDSLKLTYNADKKEITYNEVPSFEDGRFYGMPTQNVVTLKLENGKFKAK